MEQVFSPAYLRSVLRRRSLYLFAPLLVGGALTTGVVMSLPSLYASQATLLVETQQIPAELVPSTITALAGERLRVIEQRIKTRDRIVELTRKHNLMANKTNLSTSNLVEAVRKRISIEQSDLRIGGQSGNERVAMVFQISYVDENPITATNVANDLVSSILQEDARTRAALASETSRFLERESQRLAAEITEVEAALSNFRVENTNVLPDRLPYNIATLDKIEKTLLDIDRELLTIEDNKRLLSFEQSVRAAATAGPAAPGSLADLTQRIVALNAELTTLSGNYSENHPEMRARRKALVALEAQKAELEKSLGETPNEAQGELDKLIDVDARVTAEKIKTLDGRASFLNKQKTALNKEADDIRAMIKATPEVGTELGELVRRHEGLRKNLDDIAGKLQQAQLAERLEQDQYSERFEVIEQPIVPQAPSYPNRPQILAAGGALSLALGAGLAYGLEFVDDTVRTVKGFEARTGLRPIAIVPFISTAADRRRRRLMILGSIALGVVALLAAAAAVHVFLRPLDEIYYSLMRLL